MIADLVEQAEVKTGRRSEGLFFAASTFMRKWGEGFGIVLATVVLTVVGLAAGAAQGEVSDETLWRLGAVYVPTILGLWMTMIFFISRYQLDRAGHEDNLRQLAERKSAAADQPSDFTSNKRDSPWLKPIPNRRSSFWVRRDHPIRARCLPICAIAASPMP